MSEDDKGDSLEFQLASPPVSAVSFLYRSRLHDAVLLGQSSECFSVNFCVLQVDQKSQSWGLFLVFLKPFWLLRSGSWSHVTLTVLQALGAVFSMCYF